MACNIQYKDGKIINVLDDSGNPSKLYKDAVDKFGEEKGLEMYLVSKSNSFLDFFAPKNRQIKDVSLTPNNILSYEGMFSKTTTGLPYYDDILTADKEDVGYHYFYKGMKGRVELMSPSEYLKRVREGFKSYKDENITKEKVDAIENAIEKGNKIDMIYLSYVDGKFAQEGRNRAKTAEVLDEKLIPVLIVDSVTFEDKINKAQEYINYAVLKGSVEQESIIETLKKDFNIHRDFVNFIRNNFEDFSITSFSQEPTLQEVTNYVASNNRTEAELNQNQKADLINVLISTPNFKAEDFYDEFGMFIIPKKHYSRYELLTLENEEQIKEAVDALLNTDFTPNVEVIGTVEKAQVLQINEKNAFGKLVNLNPNISEKEKLREQVLNGEREDYKTAEVLIETLDGELISAKNNNTEQILPLVVKETFKTDLVSSLETFSLSTLQQGEEQTRIVLKAIENDLISQGIDAIGLAQKPVDQELVDFLNTAKTFINSPTKENTKTFAEKSDTYFERDLEPKVDIVKSEKTDRNYVKLNTNLTEEQLYEKKGLIQSELGKGIYIQTASEALEDLYNNLRTYTEKYPKGTTLEQHVQEQIAEMNYDNAENAEAIVLYKMYFDVGQNLIKDKNGNLLAPNGKISNLNEGQWKLVRTPEFISWFGDIYGNRDKVKNNFETIVRKLKIIKKCN